MKINAGLTITIIQLNKVKLIILIASYQWHSQDFGEGGAQV